jgi:hypothetical protein
MIAPGLVAKGGSVIYLPLGNFLALLKEKYARLTHSNNIRDVST